MREAETAWSTIGQSDMATFCNSWAHEAFGLVLNVGGNQILFCLLVETKEEWRCTFHYTVARIFNSLHGYLLLCTSSCKACDVKCRSEHLVISY